MAPRACIVRPGFFTVFDTSHKLMRSPAASYHIISTLSQWRFPLYSALKKKKHHIFFIHLKGSNEGHTREFGKEGGGEKDDKTCEDQGERSTRVGQRPS